MGGGCTSGHGVCGIGAGAKDAVIYTIVFMAAGVVTVFIWNAVTKGGACRMRLILILIGGGIFGAGLVISGMTDPVKVIGFLDFFGEWNPALAFVMGGAVAVFGVGLFLLRKVGVKVCSVVLPDTSANPILKRMVIGSAIFGIGWGLGGFCPGSAVANLAAMKTEVLWFFPALIVGMFLAQKVFGLDR